MPRRNDLDSILSICAGPIVIGQACESDYSGAQAGKALKAYDRQLFRQAVDRIGLASPKSRLIGSLAEAVDALGTIGLPAIIRPSFTLGGTGGGIAYNAQEFEDIVRGGLRASPAKEVLIE